MPKQERAERSRHAILDAAAEEFDRHGYDGARLERIVERSGLTKGAMYFHFSSKRDLAVALVEEKYANWPAIVAEVSDSGLRGVAAASALTHRVAAVFVDDVRVRAAMKLTQTILPPPADDNPYDRWIGIVAGFLQQSVDDGQLPGADARRLATVAVQGFFGAYMIADELGRLGTLDDDVTRLWAALAPSVRL
jgi:AcrR family transcriptional regulator